MSPGNGFPRESRLVSPAQYRRVFEKNDRQSDHYWTLLYRENGLSYSRLGMAVSKKRAKRAVDRNRLKRLLRDTFRRQQQLRFGVSDDSDGDGVFCGVDIVAMSRDSCVAADNETLVKSLNRQWSRICEKCVRL